MRAIVYLLPALVILVSVYGLAEGLARFRNRELRRENARLSAENAQLRRSEPDRMRHLREEVEKYDTLVDKILALVARRRNTLDVGPIEDSITNLIEAERPDRSV